MARTKQTARRCNTGMIPRKALARKSTRRMAAVSGPIFSEEDEADEFEVVDNFEGIEEGSSKNNGSGGLSDTNSIEAHRAVIKKLVVLYSGSRSRCGSYYGQHRPRCTNREQMTHQFLACSDCNVVKYCCHDCLRRDRKDHKQFCSIIKANYGGDDEKGGGGEGDDEKGGEEKAEV
jgi:hypothetical protein